MNAKRFLREMRFAEKRLLAESPGWKSQMPQRLHEHIVSDPLYQKLRERYFVRGPRVWVYRTLYGFGPLTSPEIYARYLADAEARAQGFFASLNHLKRHHLHFYLRDKTLAVAPFNPKLQSFRGYQLHLKNALERLDPHIVMEMRPLPPTAIARRYQALAEGRGAGAQLPASPPEIVIA